jgi:hypothetical protein
MDARSVRQVDYVLGILKGSLKFHSWAPATDVIFELDQFSAVAQLMEMLEREMLQPEEGTQKDPAVDETPAKLKITKQHVPIELLTPTAKKPERGAFAAAVLDFLAKCTEVQFPGEVELQKQYPATFGIQAMGTSYHQMVDSSRLTRGGMMGMTVSTLNLKGEPGEGGTRSTRELFGPGVVEPRSPKSPKSFANKKALALTHAKSSPAVTNLAQRTNRGGPGVASPRRECNGQRTWMLLEYKRVIPVVIGAILRYEDTRDELQNRILGSGVEILAFYCLASRQGWEAAPPMRLVQQCILDRNALGLDALVAAYTDAGTVPDHGGARGRWSVLGCRGGVPVRKLVKDDEGTLTVVCEILIELCKDSSVLKLVHQRGGITRVLYTLNAFPAFYKHAECALRLINQTSHMAHLDMYLSVEELAKCCTNIIGFLSKTKDRDIISTGAMNKAAAHMKEARKRKAKEDKEKREEQERKDAIKRGKAGSLAGAVRIRSPKKRLPEKKKKKSKGRKTGGYGKLELDRVPLRVRVYRSAAALFASLSFAHTAAEMLVEIGAVSALVSMHSQSLMDRQVLVHTTDALTRLLNINNCYELLEMCGGLQAVAGTMIQMVEEATSMTSEDMEKSHTVDGRERGKLHSGYVRSSLHFAAKIGAFEIEMECLVRATIMVTREGACAADGIGATVTGRAASASVDRSARRLNRQGATQRPRTAGATIGGSGAIAIAKPRPLTAGPAGATGGKRAGKETTPGQRVWEDGCSTLHSLVQCKANGKYVIQHGGVECVTMALRQYDGVKSVMEPATKCLSRVACSSREVADAIDASGVTTFVLSLLQKYFMFPIFTQHAVLYLSQLRLGLLEVEALAPVIAAMRHQKKQNNVQRDGSVVLSNILKSQSQKQQKLSGTKPARKYSSSNYINEKDLSLHGVSFASDTAAGKAAASADADGGECPVLLQSASAPGGSSTVVAVGEVAFSSEDSEEDEVYSEDEEHTEKPVMPAVKPEGVVKQMVRVKGIESLLNAHDSYVNTYADTMHRGLAKQTVAMIRGRKGSISSVYQKKKLQLDLDRMEKRRVDHNSDSDHETGSDEQAEDQFNEEGEGDLSSDEDEDEDEDELGGSVELVSAGDDPMANFDGAAASKKRKRRRQPKVDATLVQNREQQRMMDRLRDEVISQSVITIQAMFRLRLARVSTVVQAVRHENAPHNASVTSEAARALALLMLQGKNALVSIASSTQEDTPDLIVRYILSVLTNKESYAQELVDEGALQLLVEMGKNHTKDMRIQLAVAQSLYGFANTAEYARQILNIGGGRYLIETHERYTAVLTARGGMASKQIMTATAAVLSRLLTVIMDDYTRNDRVEEVGATTTKTKGKATGISDSLASEKERLAFDARANSRLKDFLGDAFVTILNAVSHFAEIKENAEHSLDFFATVLTPAATYSNSKTSSRDYTAMVSRLITSNELFKAVIRSGASHVYSSTVKNKCAALLKLFASTPGLIAITFNINAMKALTDAQNYYKKRVHRQVLLVPTLELVVNFYTLLAASQVFAEKLDYGGGLSVTMSVLRSSPTAEFRLHNAQAMRLMLRTIEMEHLSYTLPVVGTPSVLSVLRHDDNLGEETMQSLGCRVIMLLTETDQDTNTVVASGGLDVVAHALATHHSGDTLTSTQAALATYATQTLAKLAAHPQGSSEIMRRATDLVAGLLDSTARTVEAAVAAKTESDQLAVDAAAAAGTNPASALRLAALQLFEQLSAAEGARAFAAVEAKAAKEKAAAAAAHAAVIAAAVGVDISLLDVSEIMAMEIPKDPKAKKGKEKEEVKPIKIEDADEGPVMTTDADPDGDAEKGAVPPLRGTELGARMLTYVCRALNESAKGGNEQIIMTACSVLRLCGTAWADAAIPEKAVGDAPLCMGAEFDEALHEPRGGSDEHGPLDGFAHVGVEKEPEIDSAEQSEAPACHEILRLGALASLMQVAKLGESTSTEAMRSIVQVFTTLACDEAACSQLEQAGAIALVQRIMVASSSGVAEPRKKAKDHEIESDEAMEAAPRPAVGRTGGTGGWESAESQSDSGLVVLCLRFFDSCLAVGYRGTWSTSVADLISNAAGCMRFYAQSNGVQLEAAHFMKRYLRVDRKEVLELLSVGQDSGHVLGCLVSALEAHGATDYRVVCAGLEMLAELLHCCCGRKDEPQYSAGTSALADKLVAQPPSGMTQSLLKAAVAQTASAAGLASSKTCELLLLTIRGACDPDLADAPHSVGDATVARKWGSAYVDAGAVGVVVAIMARHSAHARLLGSAVEAMRLLGLSSPVAAANMVRAGGMRVLSHAYAVTTDDTDVALPVGTSSSSSSSSSAGRVCVLRTATSLLQQASHELGQETQRAATSTGYVFGGHSASSVLETELGVAEWMREKAPPKPTPADGEEEDATDEGSSDIGSSGGSAYAPVSAPDAAAGPIHWWESMLRTACTTPADFAHSTAVLQLCGALFGVVNAATARANPPGTALERELELEQEQERDWKRLHSRYVRLQLTLGVQLMPLVVLLLQQHEHKDTAAGTAVANGAMLLTTMLLRLQEHEGIPQGPPAAPPTPTAKCIGGQWTLVDEPVGGGSAPAVNKANVCAAVLATGGMAALMKVHTVVSAMYSKPAAGTNAQSRPELRLLSGALQALSSLARQCTSSSSSEYDREVFGQALKGLIDGTWNAPNAEKTPTAQGKGKGKGKGKAKDAKGNASSGGGSGSNGAAAAGPRGALLGLLVREIAEVMSRFGVEAQAAAAELEELRILSQSTLLFVACCNRWVSLKPPPLIETTDEKEDGEEEDGEATESAAAAPQVEVAVVVDPKSLIPPLRILLVGAGAVEAIVSVMSCGLLTNDAQLQNAGAMCLRDLTCERALVAELASREEEYVTRLKSWGVLIETAPVAAEDVEEVEETEPGPIIEGTLVEAVVRCSLQAHAIHSVATPAQLVAMLAAMAVDLTEVPDALDEAGNRKGFVDAKSKRPQVVGVAPGLVRGGALAAVIVWLGGQRFLPAPQLHGLGFEAPASAQLGVPVQEQALQVLVAMAEAGDGEHIPGMLDAGIVPVLGLLHVQFCTLMMGDNNGGGEGGSDAAPKAAAKNATNVLLLLMGVKEAATHVVACRGEDENPLTRLNKTLLQHPAESEHTLIALKMLTKVGRFHSGSANEAAELSAAGCVEAIMGCIFANTSKLEVCEVYSTICQRGSHFLTFSFAFVSISGPAAGI